MGRSKTAEQGKMKEKEMRNEKMKQGKEEEAGQGPGAGASGSARTSQLTLETGLGTGTVATAWVQSTQILVSSQGMPSSGAGPGRYRMSLEHQVASESKEVAQRNKRMAACPREPGASLESPQWSALEQSGDSKQHGIGSQPEI